MSLDTKVKNLIINTNMTKEQYEAIDDKSNQLFFVEDSSVVDVPAPEENKSGYLHTDGTNLTWKEIESDDYLPITGGEMTGRIAFNTPPIPNSNVPIIAFPKNSSVNLFIANSASGEPNNLGVNGNFVVTDNISTTSLGNTSKKVEIAYTKKLNNGADLDIPTVGGTLARVEDIPEDTQLETLPVASADNLNKIYQYVGETTSDYTQGHFYKSINHILV